LWYLSRLTADEFWQYSLTIAELLP